jgi:acetoin utilization deacetylase AcuC-like enzyme
MSAVDRVLKGKNRNAFCVVRPPGHHAGTHGLLADASSHGFCIFNRYANVKSKRGLEKSMVRVCCIFNRL